MNFFNLPHLFVVFHPGAAGNFICTLLERLRDRNFSNLHIKGAGSVHMSIDKKRAGKDYLSFGTEAADKQFFPGEEQRLKFYLDGITKEYSSSDQVQITWTHDFSNIPIYRKYFPNSRILVITQESVNEKLTSTFMNIVKNFMDQETASPLTPERFQQITRYFLAESAKDLYRKLPKDKLNLIRPILENRFDSKFNAAATFLFISVIVRLYKMESLLLGDNSKDRVNSIIYQDFSYKPEITADFDMGIQGPEYSSFYDNQIFFLKYHDIMFSEHDKMLSVLEAVTEDAAPRSNLIPLIDNYRSRQISKLINDPVAYYADLEKSLDKIVYGL